MSLLVLNGLNEVMEVTYSRPVQPTSTLEALWFHVQRNKRFISISNEPSTSFSVPAVTFDWLQ